MEDTLRCPGCQAQLLLPSLPAGQTVQCPRCQNVFEPFAQRARAAPAAAPPVARAVSVRIEDETLDDPRRWKKPEPMRGGWKAPVAMVMLMLSIASFGPLIHVHYEQMQLATRQEKQNRLVNELDFRRRDAAFQRLMAIEQERQRWERYASNVSKYHHLVLWPTIFFFLLWLHQASSNVRLLRVADVTFRPPWAVGSFFLPFVNVFIPYAVFQELWRTSDPRGHDNPNAWKLRPASWLIRVWWGLFVTAAAFPFVGAIWFEMTRGTNFESHWAMSWCVSNALMMSAGVLLIAIIRQIARRQPARYAQFHEGRADG